MQKLKDDGHTKSAAAVTKAMSTEVISFEAVAGAEANPEAGPVPADLVASSGMGDTFDEVAKPVLTQAWSFLRAVHEPPAVAGRI